MDPRTVEARASEILAAYLGAGNDTTPTDWVTALYQAEDELAGRRRRIVLIELPEEEDEPQPEIINLDLHVFAEVVANPEPSCPSDLYFVTIRQDGGEILDSYSCESPYATFSEKAFA